MRCRACGAEVVEQAIYCHKCGERLDVPPPGQVGDSSSPEDARERAGPGQPSPIQRFKEAAAARQGETAEPEKELWTGDYSPRAMFAAWMGTAALTILLLIVWGVWVRNTIAWIALVLAILALWLFQLLVLGYRRLSVRYCLTTQRLIHQRGLLRRTTDRIEVIDIDDVTFVQGILERLVGVGTIRIISSDRSDPELTMPGIENVKEVADLIDDVRRGERRRRGLHIEQI